MTGPEQNRLKLTDNQKKDIVALQKAVDGRFDNVLTEAQKKQIKSAFTPAVPAQATVGSLFGRLVQSVFATAAPPRVKPGAGNAGDSQAGNILSPGQQDMLRLSPEQRKRMTEIQKEIDAKLDTLLTEDQRKQLQAMRTRITNPKSAAPAGSVRASGTPLFRAYRYGIDYPGFAGKKLIPGRPLEELQANELE